MGHLQRLRLRAQNAFVPPWWYAGRVIVSLIRRCLPGHRSAVVAIDSSGTHVLADLTRPSGLALFRYGFPAPEGLLVTRLLAPGDIFIDGGANVGILTLLAAQTVGPGGRVLACEPVPENLALLESNLRLNKFYWVDKYAVALGQQDGTATFASFGAANGLSSFAPAVYEGAEDLIVQVITLDSLVASLSSRVALVKLDIEGSEVLALRSGSSLLRMGSDFLIEVEPSHLERQGTTISELREIFSRFGYVGYRIIQHSRLEISIELIEDWVVPTGNPNMLVSARPIADIQRLIRA